MQSEDALARARTFQNSFSTSHHQPEPGVAARALMEAATSSGEGASGGRTLAVP